MAWNPNMPYTNNMGMNVPGYNPTPYMTSNAYSTPPMAPQFAGMNNVPMQGNQMPVSTAIQGRMVASKEEALGVPADFSGQPMFFPDLGHNVIYCKKFNAATGSADFGEFRYVQPQPQQNSQPQTENNMNNKQFDFAPLQDFNNLTDAVSNMQDTINTLQKEIDRLKKPANSTGKVVAKNESSSK